MNTYTKEELDELREVVNSITTHIPTQMAGYIWNNYKRIADTNERQPCNCGSSAGLWRKAVDTIREYLKNVE